MKQFTNWVLTPFSHRVWQYVGVAWVLVVGFIFLRGSTWQGNKELHTLMEVAATFLALMVGTLALIRFYSKKSNTYLFIGAGFLGTGFLDCYHAIATSAWFDAVMPSGPPHLIPWSWNASRTFLAVLMFLSWWAWQREDRLGKTGRLGEKMVYTFVTFLTLASFVFFSFAPLPRAYYPELFFGRPQEFVSALFFLLALVGYLRKGHWKQDVFEHWVVLSLVVGFLGQAMFMSFSFRLFDPMFNLAHLLKKTSYFFVLTGLFISIYHLFRREEKNTIAIHQAFEANSVTKGYMDNIMKSIVDMLIVVDPDGKIRTVNQPLCDLLEFQEEELIGKQVGTILVDDDDDDDDDSPFEGTKLKKLIEASSLRDYEMTYQTKSGNKIPVSFSGAVMYETREEGRKRRDEKDWPREAGVHHPSAIVGIVGIARDMTEQMKSHEMMKKLSGVIRQTQDSVLITDRNGVIEFVNEAFERLTGYTFQEAVGKTPRILKSGKHQKRFYEKLWKTILSGEPYHADFINKKKNGQFYDEEQVITPIKNEKGEVVHFVSTARDATSRKQAQREMEDARAVLMSVLEDSNEAKARVEKREQELKEAQAMLIQAGKLTAIGQLGAGVAHELNQPIAAIMGFSQLLLTQLPPGSPLLGNLKLIEKQSQRMATIVDNIRTFSRSSKGEHQQVPVNQVIDDSVMLISAQLKSHRVKVEKDLDPDLPLIWADQNKLQQVFINLLTNARDAIDEKGDGGVLTLSTRCSGKEWVECRIQDTGIGIQESIRERLYDPFFTTKPPGKGTGLGLSILYGIVEDHGGMIDFESEPGKGTTFIVRLPVDTRKKSAERSEGQKEEKRKKVA